MKLNSEKIKILIESLKISKKTISTMESCTGGFIASCITNNEGASKVFSSAYVTYSNESKIKQGVNESTIDKYTVYSKEVAQEMAYNANINSNSNYGIGVTGKLGLDDEIKLVYISIYNRDTKEYLNQTATMSDRSREENKILLANLIFDCLFKMIYK